MKTMKTLKSTLRGARAVVLAATMATLVASHAEAGRTNGYAISVTDTVYAGYSTAVVTEDSRQNYVLVQCYAPDLSGTYVYAMYFDVFGTEALLGPVWAATWPASAAECKATLGYFMRDGWGRWKPLAQTHFNIDP